MFGFFSDLADVTFHSWNCALSAAFHKPYTPGFKYGCVAVVTVLLSIVVPVSATTVHWKKSGDMSEDEKSYKFFVTVWGKLGGGGGGLDEEGVVRLCQFDLIFHCCWPQSVFCLCVFSTTSHYAVSGHIERKDMESFQCNSCSACCTHKSETGTNERVHYWVSTY